MRVGCLVYTYGVDLCEPIKAIPVWYGRRIVLRVQSWQLRSEPVDVEKIQACRGAVLAPKKLDRVKTLRVCLGGGPLFQAVAKYVQRWLPGISTSTFFFVNSISYPE